MNQLHIKIAKAVRELTWSLSQSGGMVWIREPAPNRNLAVDLMQTARFLSPNLYQPTMLGAQVFRNGAKTEASCKRPVRQAFGRRHGGPRRDRVAALAAGQAGSTSRPPRLYVWQIIEV